MTDLALSFGKRISIYLFTLLFLLVLGSGLFNSNLFYYPSLTAFFLFLIAVCLVMLFLAGLFWQRETVVIPSDFRLVIAITLLGYIVFNAAFVAHVYTPYHQLLIFGILLFLCFSVLLKNVHGQLKTLLLVITSLGALESLVCLAQALNTTSSNSNFFKVSGTWQNPNVTAMFIAMVVPAAFILKQAAQGIYRKLLIAFLILAGLSLLLLKMPDGMDRVNYRGNNSSC